MFVWTTLNVSAETEQTPLYDPYFLHLAVRVLMTTEISETVKLTVFKLLGNVYRRFAYLMPRLTCATTDDIKTWQAALQKTAHAQQAPTIPSKQTRLSEVDEPRWRQNFETSFPIITHPVDDYVPAKFRSG